MPDWHKLLAIGEQAHQNHYQNIFNLRIDRYMLGRLRKNCHLAILPPWNTREIRAKLARLWVLLITLMLNQELFDLP